MGIKEKVNVRLAHAATNRTEEMNRDFTFWVGWIVLYPMRFILLAFVCLYLAANPNTFDRMMDLSLTDD